MNASHPDARLRLTVLGPVDLRGEAGVPVSELLAQPKRVALLAFLLLGSPASFQRRDSLLPVFWPESDEAHARNGLSRALYVIRRTLGPDVITSRGGDEIGVNPELVWCDAVDFGAAAVAGDLDRAVHLYGGPLLEGLHVRNAPQFMSWVDEERARLARLHGEVASRLARTLWAQGELHRSEALWRGLLRDDPANAEVVLGLIGVLAESGNRTTALEEAKRHAALLAREYDLEPDPRVLALERRLRVDPPAIRTFADPHDAAPGEPAIPTIASNEAAGPTVTRHGEGPRRWGRRRVLAAGLTAIGLTALGVAFFGSRPPSEAPVGRTIAVLPFQVSGEGMEFWREGAADLLSTNLNAIGGLSTVDGRVLFARLDSIREESPEATLRVLEGLGVTYAISGSAWRAGTEVRLAAGVVRLPDGESLGEVRAEGAVDSMFTFVDRLSVDLIRAVLTAEGTDAPVAALLTSSMPATRAYLEGEAWFRRGDYARAAEAFSVAVREDPSLALARLRLDGALGSLETFGRARSENWRALLGLADRLPARERALVAIQDAFNHGTATRAAERVEYFVWRYPHDPRGWYWLGDVQYHFHDQLLLEEDGERALGRAVELVPDYAPYRAHLIDLAFQHWDSTKVRTSLAEYEARSGVETPHLRVFRLARMLAFGDTSVRARGWAAVDTSEIGTLLGVAGLLAHANGLSVQERLLRLAAARIESPEAVAYGLFWNLRSQGRLAEAARVILPSTVDRATRALAAYSLVMAGERGGLVDEALAFSPADTMSWFPSGARAAELGRWVDHRRAVDALRGAAALREAEGDSLWAERFAGASRAVDAYGRLVRGGDQRVLEQLEASQREVIGHDFFTPGWNEAIRYWLGGLHASRREWTRASVYFTAQWHLEWAEDPFAAYLAAVALDHAGEAFRAASAYEYVITAWQRADPSVLPRVDSARAALDRLALRR